MTSTFGCYRVAYSTVVPVLCLVYMVSLFYTVCLGALYFKDACGIYLDIILIYFSLTNQYTLMGSTFYIYMYYGQSARCHWRSQVCLQLFLESQNINTIK